MEESVSFAYEVTPDEVYEVLEAHGVAQSAEDAIVDDGYVTVAELEGRITEAVLEYGDAATRRAVALQEIEAILIEDGLLEEPRLAADS